MRITNGTPADRLRVTRWRKSRASNPSGSCVEIGELPDDSIAVRNSRDKSGPALIYPRAEIAAFLEGVKNGEFDHMLALGERCARPFRHSLKTASRERGLEKSGS